MGCGWRRCRSRIFILLDVMMPDMAGSRVAEELSEDPATIITQEEINFIAKPVMIDTRRVKLLTQAKKCIY